MTFRAHRATGAAVAAAVLCVGCASLSESPLTSWMTWIPAPSFAWLTGGSRKPGPLPQLEAKVTPRIAWQQSVGRAAPGIAPAVTPSAIYAAATDGTLMRLDVATGRVVWKTSANKPLSAGPGAGESVVVVGTAKGEVLAFDADGKPLWTAHVSSEVIAPPRVSGTIVIVFSGDGRVYGLAAADGKTAWVDQRINPPLTVRNSAGGVVSRGGLLVGTPGGRLLAVDTQTGTVAWEGAVATPRGATELERIADVTSLPYVDESEVCAAAYQGRVACFELVRGSLIWSRDVSSLAGITADTQRLYVVDDKGVVHAFDRSNGASVWKQDVLAKRRIGGPQLVGDDLGVVDVEGYLHVLSRTDGAYVGRLATDGSLATAQPIALGGGLLWQSEKGTVFSVVAR
jgi:outer membrane protein assembly factor BamB